MKHTILILLAATSLLSCAKKEEAYPKPAPVVPENGSGSTTTKPQSPRPVYRKSEPAEATQGANGMRG